MSEKQGIDRRAFLRNAGLTAIVGAAGSRGAFGGVAAEAAAQSAGTRFDFDTPYNRIGFDSVKWDGALRTIKLSGGDNIVAGMGIADIDFKCAPSVTKALMERVQHENWGYNIVPDSFEQGIIAWNKRRHGIDIPPDLLGISTGVHGGLIAGLRAFNPRGSKVILLTPAYNGFWFDLEQTGTRGVESPLKYANGRYSFDFDDIDRKIDRETHSLILCNPNNPTGNMWSKQDLTTLGELCLKRRVVVLSDEIHCDWLNKGQTYTPFASLENRAIVDNSVTFKAASKSFGLAAFKCAWFFSTNPKNYEAVQRAAGRVDLAAVSMVASKAAYEGGEEWLRQANEYVDANHDFVHQYVKANIPMIKLDAKAEGTYLMWIDVSQVAEKIGAKQMAAEANKNRQPGAPGTPATAEQMVQKWFEKNAGVQLNAGSTYGKVGENHMRMNIGTSRRTLEKALASMANALKRAGSVPTAAI
jgi:cystathionine beta-lyase